MDVSEHRQARAESLGSPQGPAEASGSPFVVEWQLASPAPVNGPWRREPTVAERTASDEAPGGAPPDPHSSSERGEVTPTS